MEKTSAYVNAETGEVVDSLPEGARVVRFKKHMPLPVWNSDRSTPGSPGRSSSDWINWLLAGGTGLLAHQISSSMMDEPDEEEKKKESTWKKVMRMVMPIGIGAAGAYGGYLLGDHVKKAADAYYSTEREAGDLEDTADALRWWSWLPITAGGVSAGVAGKGAFDWIRHGIAARNLPDITRRYQAARAADRAMFGGGGRNGPALSPATIELGNEQGKLQRWQLKRNGGRYAIGGAAGTLAALLTAWGLRAAANSYEEKSKPFVNPEDRRLDDDLATPPE